MDMKSKGKKPKVELDFLMAAPAEEPEMEEEEMEEERPGGDANALIAEIQAKLDRLSGIVGTF